MASNKEKTLFRSITMQAGYGHEIGTYDDKCSIFHKLHALLITRQRDGLIDWDWVKVLCSTRHTISHLRDTVPSQYLSSVLQTEPNTTEASNTRIS